jgi:hypothetical protein
MKQTPQFNKGFSDGQPLQGIYKVQRFGDQLRLHHQGDGSRCVLNSL